MAMDRKTGQLEVGYVRIQKSGKQVVRYDMIRVRLNRVRG